MTAAGDGGADKSSPPVEPKIEHLVVVGSSAGGIEALGTLLGGLDRTFPAPVILAQHLDPHHQSHLQTVLQRKTELPVVLVNDRETLRPGSVYVVPANRHVVVNDGTVAVESGGGSHPQPSVDLLLRTAAQAYGERLVAVILTGSGSDGAAGAVDVKHEGGTIVIQDPRTARYPSMPLALPPTVVDHVVDIGRMASLLKNLVLHVPVPAVRESIDTAVAKVIALVSGQSDIDFQNYKSSTLLRRIGRRMSAVRCATVDEYLHYLEAQPDEVGQLARDLLINVTEFFRDREAFLFLRNAVLPEIVERGRKRGRQLRFWSAGCSTGEEAYSLLMAVAEVLGPELPQWNVRVFATDVDDDAVAFARRGLYPENVLGAVSDAQKDQFFEKADHNSWRIHKTLRQMVIFGTQDLGRGVPFPRIDLVLCRNLLIYFKPEKQNQVLDVFAYSLAPSQGYLFLGKAETVRPSHSTFEEVNKRYKVYRCLSAPPLGPDAARHQAGAASSLAAKDARPQTTVDEALPASDLRRFNDLILRAMPAGLIVIDRGYRIVTSNPAARRLLQVRDHPGDDFLHAARALPYDEMRASIDTAFRDRVPATLPEVSVAAGPEERYVQITISRVQPDDGTSDYAVIALVDVTDSVRSARRLRISEDEQRLLVDDLSTTNKRLADLNKDLQDSNEELQAANEELLLAHEEMQATNEEFEATNEELQATNEELETNNEEMQATNEELETTNEELAARSSELNELTRTLTGERRRLADMVELAPFAMMILKGPGLVIESFNPAATRILATEDARGRAFEEVFAADAALIDGVRGAYRSGKAWSSPSRVLTLRTGSASGEERTFRFVAVPTRLEGSAEGLVLYGEDLTGLAAPSS